MLKSDFKVYEEARAYAQKRANKLRVAHGIEKNTALPGFGPWVVSLLPKPENRYGWELRCEVVEAEAEAPI